MQRALLQQLLTWKTNSNRKPLIMEGARQVGKTWLMKEFGKTAFTNVVYLNFESSSRLKEIFLPDFDIQRLLTVFK